MRGPFLPIFMFWALLLKIQTPITLVDAACTVKTNGKTRAGANTQVVENTYSRQGRLGARSRNGGVQVKAEYLLGTSVVLAWKENKAKCYYLVLSHCPRALEYELKNFTKWEEMEMESNQDMVSLLQMITAELSVSYRADKKSICQRTRRATTLLRPPLKSSRRGESRSTEYIFLWSFLTSYFLKQVKIWSQQKYTQQNQIRLVKYSSSEVSGPSEVPRFVGKFIF